MEGAIQIFVCLYFSPAIGWDSITNGLNLHLSDGTNRVLNFTFGRILNQMSFIKSVAILSMDGEIQVFKLLFVYTSLKLSDETVLLMIWTSNYRMEHIKN